MNFTISYQPQLLEPPIAYAAVMQIKLEDVRTKLDFNLEYLGREEMSDKELKAAGFTGDDDFSWSGELSTDWNNDISLLSQQTFNADPDAETYLHIEANAKELGYPSDIEKAEMLFQELMQAVLEKAEIEAPLQLELQHKNERFNLKWLFSERHIEASNGKHISWELGRELLRAVYSLDFDSIKPKKMPGGTTVNFGDDTWFELREGETKRIIDQVIAS